MLYYKHKLEKPTLSSLIVKRALVKMEGRVHVKSTLKTTLMKETMVFKKIEVWRIYCGLRNLPTMSTSLMQDSRRGRKVRRVVREERHRGKVGMAYCTERGGMCKREGMMERERILARCMQRGRGSLSTQRGRGKREEWTYSGQEAVRVGLYTGREGPEWLDQDWDGEVGGPRH